MRVYERGVVVIKLRSFNSIGGGVTRVGTWSQEGHLEDTTENLIKNFIRQQQFATMTMYNKV